MGKGARNSAKTGRQTDRTGDNRQHNNESPPARRWTKREQQSKGRSCAGIGSKFHLAITNWGQVVEGFVTGAHVADVSVAAQLTRDIVGYPVIADKGYDSDEFRRYLHGSNNTPVIPGRKNCKKKILYDEKIYGKRGLIERTFGKIKDNRRLALRFEKSDINFIGFILCAFIKIFLNLYLC